LGDGAYVVTPVSGARYFYPFFRNVTLAGNSATGVDFDMYTLPTGDVDGGITGTVSAIDAANYNLTLDDGSGPLTLFIHAGTIFSGSANSLDDIGVGWSVSAQYYTSANLAVEIDAEP